MAIESGLEVEFEDSPHNNYDTINLPQRYPCRRREYCERVGEEGQTMIQAALQQVINPTYPKAEVFSNPVHNNGPDIQIYDHGLIIFKAEVLTLRLSSYIKDPRARHILKNMRGVRHKALITTHPLKLKSVRRILRNVPICILGFQPLPEDIYNYYSLNNPEVASFAKIARNSMVQSLKELLRTFLTQTGFISPMYIRTSSSSGLSGLSGGCVGEVVDETCLASSVNVPFCGQKSFSPHMDYTSPAYGIRRDSIRIMSNPHMDKDPSRIRLTPRPYTESNLPYAAYDPDHIRERNTLIMSHILKREEIRCRLKEWRKRGLIKS